MLESFRSVNRLIAPASLLRCCVFGGLCLIGLHLAGCATAEKKQYVEHLTHMVQPSDKPDAQVAAAFQLEDRDQLSSIMATAVGRDNPSADTVR